MMDYQEGKLLEQIRDEIKALAANSAAEQMRHEAEAIDREIRLAREITTMWQPDQPACVVCGAPWEGFGVSRSWTDGVGYSSGPDMSNEGNLTSLERHLAQHAAEGARTGLLMAQAFRNYSPSHFAAAIVAHRIREAVLLPEEQG